jgi:hypothetical protein
MRFFLPAKPKDFTVNREVLRSKQMAALQSRHDAGLTDKIIARAIGRDPDTIGNWRLGKTEMKIGDLIALDNFFASMGDWMFLEHVCGELAVRRRLRADQLEREVARLRQSANYFDAGMSATA